jgi:hypothetical protein
LKLIVTVLMTFLVAGCGGNGSSGACGADCNMKSDCSSVGASLTAVQALAAGRTAAAGALSGTPKWVGAIQGLKITRPGTPSMVADAEIGGVKIFTSGWVFKYCAGMDEIVFGAGPPTGSAQRGCGTFDCAQITEPAAPAIDAPQAISIAFPSDPADTVYDLFLNLGSRVWQVTQRPNALSVKVDADTGAIVP